MRTDVTLNNPSLRLTIEHILNTQRVDASTRARDEAIRKIRHPFTNDLAPDALEERRADARDNLEKRARNLMDGGYETDDLKRLMRR